MKKQLMIALLSIAPALGVVAQDKLNKVFETFYKVIMIIFS